MFFGSVCSFFSYLNALHTFLARVQGFSLMVTTHNSTALKEHGITEDILFLVSWGSKHFVSSHWTQKGPDYPTIFLFLCFLLLTYTNPSTLMDVKQLVRVLPF